MIICTNTISNSKRVTSISEGICKENMNVGHINTVQLVVSRHLMSSHFIFFLRWLLMIYLLMRNLPTFSSKRSLMSSLLSSWCMNLYNDVSRLLLRYLLTCDFFAEKVSRFLMRRLLMRSPVNKEMRWLLMRYQLTTTWTGLISAIRLTVVKKAMSNYSLTMTKAFWTKRSYNRR